MPRPLRPLALLALLLGALPASGQNRVPFNEQELFLSGGNVAWINFARDIGPGQTDLDRFDGIFEELHANGGNTMRLWLHTTGEVTPAFSTTEVGVVTGPGAGAIEDLRAILDAAWEHEVGLVLCLWSFDMLQSGRSAAQYAQNRAILLDTAKTQTYIDNALVPMVEALADHPAAVAWEIFNEPEGMTTQFGWTPASYRVSMADVQRFVNLTAGAIHRAAPGATVTNGSWSFYASSDNVPGANRMNYYRDDRLVAAGGDPDGTLDIYTVHYYEWGGTTISPFHHDAAYWGLDKPLVIAEFFVGGGTSSGGDGNDDAVFGVPYQDLYTTLYDRGYAGALAWQWFNYPTSAEGVVNWPRMLGNAATLSGLHPEAVDVDAGFRLSSFTAEPEGIEAGQTSTLSWSVSGAASVTLDGEAVDAVGTREVSPAEETTYTLVAVDADDAANADTAHVTVRVLDPSEVNRALGRPATASTVETCCGAGRGPEAAVDGDPATRWSSAWNDGAAGGTPDAQLDSDPDDEWLAVDLGAAYDVSIVVLVWEAAFGTQYDIETSYDGQLWAPVYEERAGDGGRDTLRFETPVSVRYVRMHGRKRASISGSKYGFSLWEMEVYGLESSVQPPSVEITNPGLMAVLAPGTTTTVTASASDADGTVVSVAFFLDGEPLATDDAAPFAAMWASAEAGDHVLTAVATDDGGIAVSTAPYWILVAEASAFRRFEAEAGALSGDAAAVAERGASGGAYVSFNGESGGSIVWTLQVGRAGPATVTVGYNLPFGEKTQYLVVNGDTTAVRFTGPTNQWLQRRVDVDLVAGENEVRLERFWGYMSVDYLGVDPVVVDATAVGGAPEATLALAPGHPNPFSASTTIPFAVPEAGAVRLDVLDVTGRLVATLVDGVVPAGAYVATLDGAALSSGVYVVRLQAGADVAVRQIVKVRR